MTETNRQSGVSTPVIVLEHLSKRFGPFAALRDVSAEFAAGKLYAILGDNGAGKTTLLRVLAGLAKPSAGGMTILGAEGFRQRRHDIGYMAHASLLYDEMSASENLRYFAALHGVEDHRRCAEILRAVKLDPTLARPVGLYSQGMRQRASLARALLHDPKVLLLDEPFSNVDLGSAREMVSLLASMRDDGKTILVVTHQAALLQATADEFVWMQGGRIGRRSRRFEAAAADSGSGGRVDGE